MSSKCRCLSPAFSLGGSLREISCFVDESGSDNLRDRYSLIALVLHEQSEPFTQEIGSYEQSLGDKELPDIPLHADPLMTGYEDCAGTSIANRKCLLSSARVFLRNLPIRYTCISLRLSEFEDKAEVEAAMRRAIANYLFEHLAYFQGFDDIKIYYDDGEDTVAHAMHGAMICTLP